MHAEAQLFRFEKSRMMSKSTTATAFIPSSSSADGPFGAYPGRGGGSITRTPGGEALSTSRETPSTSRTWTRSEQTGVVSSHPATRSSIVVSPPSDGQRSDLLLC
ncbi:unnamed protein product [Amoebophrya sp. A25]|nr:unnamed protein product [Amoebophrya sp. A25]|eukprot:GSA25T00008103001.1